jgi:ribosome-associated protein
MTKKTKTISEAFAILVEKQLHDSKAENIIKIDLVGKSSICDYMYMATGTSNRHVKSIADNLEQAFQEAGAANIAIEGTENCQWVLIDAGDVIVHVFQPEARETFKLEEIWQKKKH